MEDKKVIVKTKLKTPLYKGDPTFANGSITICWTFHCDMGKKAPLRASGRNFDFLITPSTCRQII